MKFKPTAPMTTVAIYAFLVIAASIVFGMLLSGIGGVFTWFGKIAGYLTPVIYGFCIAFLLSPILHTYEKRLLPKIGGKKLKPIARRNVSILLTYLTAITIIALFLAVVLPQVIRSCMSIADNIPLYLKTLQNLYRNINGSLANIDLLNEPELAAAITSLSDSIIGMMQSQIEGIGTWLAELSTKVLGFAGNLAGGIINFVVGIIISVYLLADREKLFAQMRKISSAIFPQNVHELLYEIVLDCNRVFSGFIVGKIIDSVIVGIICFIGMSILGMPYPVLISVLVGVTNVIPYFGPFIGAIPSFFIILISDPAAALWFLLFILLLQQFDGNILGPKILGDVTGLSALWVVVSIMLFSGLFGVLGMFIGVPLFAVIYSIMKRVVNFLLQKKELPTSTRNYDTNENPLIK